MYGESSGKKLPLSKEVPVIITAHKIGDNWIVDPTLEEEDVSEARITIGGMKDGTISSIQKGEPKDVSVEEFGAVIDLTEKVREKVFSSVEKYLK